MGGFDSDNFQLFETQLVNAFCVLTNCMDDLLMCIEIFQRMPEILCFQGFSLANYRKLFPAKDQEVHIPTI